MRKFSIASMLVLGLVLVGVSQSAFAADSYTCIKPKSLKEPVPVPFAPLDQSVLGYGIGPSTCAVGKLAQVCMPSNVGSDLAAEFAVAQCCFKVKCVDAFSETSYLLDDNADGAGTFSQAVTTKSKASMVCIPCSYAAL